MLALPVLPSGRFANREIGFELWLALKENPVKQWLPPPPPQVLPLEKIFVTVTGIAVLWIVPKKESLASRVKFPDQVPFRVVVDPRTVPFGHLFFLELSEPGFLRSMSTLPNAPIWVPVLIEVGIRSDPSIWMAPEERLKEYACLCVGWFPVGAVRTREMERFDPPENLNAETLILYEFPESESGDRELMVKNVLLAA
jgi:hypothetical protein